MNPILRAVSAPLVLIGALLGQPAAANEPAAVPQSAAWTPSSLRSALAALPKGDAQRGQVVHQELFCASCHGNAGQAPTFNWPHTAAQRGAYTAKMLLDYQSRRRLENKGAELMHDIAVLMTPQQIADVSAYYASQPAPMNDCTPRPSVTAANAAAAEKLVQKGDTTRLITPCASCHGARGQGGKLEASALAGQNPQYLVRTLLDYQSGTRSNDAAHGMRAFAKRLTREEVDALASYYANLSKR